MYTGGMTRRGSAHPGRLARTGCAARGRFRRDFANGPRNVCHEGHWLKRGQFFRLPRFPGGNVCEIEHARPMRITDGLLGEHALFYPLFDSIEEVAASVESAEELKAAVKVLESAVLTHASLEEEVLFPALAGSQSAGGPLSVMRAEHQHIDRLVVALGRSTTLEQAKDELGQLLLVLRDHFRKEEQLVFPMCEEYIGEAKLLELGQIWAEKRGL